MTLAVVFLIAYALAILDTSVSEIGSLDLLFLLTGVLFPVVFLMAGFLYHSGLSLIYFFYKAYY